MEKSQPANEPEKPVEKAAVQDTRALAAAFVQSPQLFYDRMLALNKTLEGTVRTEFDEIYPEELEESGRCINVNRLYWAGPKDFDFSGFVESAYETYAAWQIARQINEEISQIHGEALLPLILVLEGIGSQDLIAGSDPVDKLSKACDAFNRAIKLVESFVREKELRAQNTLQRRQDAHGFMARSIAAEERKQEESEEQTNKKLPFGLELCDVPQALKRIGYKNVVTIANLDYWNLMKALMKAFPNPVAETTLNLICPGENDRDNHRRKLNDILDDIGLKVQKWKLMT